MNYRNFGKTGIKVSQLVFGGGAVGGLIINQDDETRQAAIRRALAAGINWIDTAPLYGQGRSEEALGWLLKEIDGKPYLSTKFVIDTADMGDIAGQIERSLTESFERLQCSSVTLLQLHNPIGEKKPYNSVSGYMISAHDVLRTGGVLDGLDRLKDQGMFDHYGITAIGEAPEIVKVIESGRIASAQVIYNMLNPGAGYGLPQSWPAYNFTGILDACQKQNVAAMIIRVFSAGVLATDQRTGREAPLTLGDSVDSETAKATAVFDKIGTDYGSQAQTAIRFALSENKASCVVFGLAELEHLEEALAAEAKGPLPEEALEKIRSVYQQGIA
ncbi:aldo/keto reductase [Thermodesulfobacteriota bacterium]